MEDVDDMDAEVEQADANKEKRDLAYAVCHPPHIPLTMITQFLS